MSPSGRSTGCFRTPRADRRKPLEPVDTRLRDSRCQRDRDPPVGRIAHRPQELAWYLRDAPTDSSRLVISKDLPFSGLMPFSGHLVVTSPGHPALIDPLQLGKMGHTKGHTTVATDGDRRFLAARPCTHVTIHDFSLVQPAPQTPGPARLGTMALLRAMFSYYPWPSRGGRRGPAKKSEAPKGAAENGPFLGVTLLTEAQCNCRCATGLRGLQLEVEHHWMHDQEFSDVGKHGQRLLVSRNRCAGEFANGETQSDCLQDVAEESLGHVL